MKTKSIILTIICGLSVSAAAQNTGSSTTGGSQLPGTIDTNNNGLLNPDLDNGSSRPGSTNFIYRRRIIEPGLNNPNYRNNPGYDYGVITNGFGSKAITNGFEFGAITNRFGSGTLTNGFVDSGLTNKFGRYTNYEINNEYRTNDSYSHYNYTNRHRPPYVTDPRVMGNNGVNNTN